MKPLAYIVFLFSIAACSDGELTNMHRLSNGAKLYKANCANCHQEKGEGLARLMPPIMQSDWLLANTKELPCIIKNGNKQPLLVNGVVYKQPMPSFSYLTDSEINDICIYVAQKFGNYSFEEAELMFSDSLISCN